jgi:hypothetical protein
VLTARRHISTFPARQAALAMMVAPLLALTQMAAAAMPPEAPAGIEEARRQRNMAEDLARATASDAATFDKAIASPELRAELERALHKQLTPETLRTMAAQARAEADYWNRYRLGIERVYGAELTVPGGRRAPGLPPPSSGIEPIVNPAGLPPPKPFETGGYVPLPDRWRILDALGRKENPFDPYNTNTYKADKPIFGEDWFLSLDGISDTRYEPSRVPLGSLPTFTARPDTHNTFSRYGRTLFNQTAIATFDLFKGNTAFKPPELEFVFTPAFNYNHIDLGEVGFVNINPAKGTSRDDSFLGIQEAFVDYHIRDVSEYYDFDSVRVGIQPFNADFRGFLFQDQQLGVRLFGDRDNNRLQYNLAYFRRINKDTNSGLNAITQQLRRDDIFVANLFHQDLPVVGFTSQLIYLRNDNREGSQFYYDKNGFLVRPLQIGDDRGYDYHVNYLGYNGDGHFGRLNLTTSAYWAIGSVSHNQFSPDPQNKGAGVNAFFVAAEPSMDFDFVRVRLSGLFQSGAGHPKSRENGFDAPFENPQFAGADTSYFIRQSIPLIAGGGVSINTMNGVLADLRAGSKGEGQSNFNNPGLFLAGIGTDTDILPELRLSTNFNYLRFENTQTLELLRQQANIPHTLGYDLSAALTYRPLFSQNIILRLSASALFPGDGLKALFNTQGGSTPFGSGNFLYAVLANVIVAY